MGLSWHDKDYGGMVREMEDYFRNHDELLLSEGMVHDIVGKMVNIMIDHGAVDPT